MNRVKPAVLILVVAGALVLGAWAVADPQPKPGTDQESSWEKLKSLAGVWKGTDESKSSPARIERDFEMIVQGKFLLVRTKSVSEKETHEDWAIFSYDRGRKTVMMRQFASEGFINLFALDEVSPDGTTMVFLSEHCENAPKGFRVRMTYVFEGEDEFTQAIDLAPPGAEFSRCVGGRLHRQK